MTEYWVSQGNKWCDYCKIFISNNKSSITNHELGVRHKENVAKRLATMRKDNVAKEKEQKEAVRALEQIEAKAKRSYQKDVANVRENAPALDLLEEEKWELESSSGYYYNQSNGLYYDPNSGFYYSDAIGKWVTQAEAYASSSIASSKGTIIQKPSSSAAAGPITANKDIYKPQTGPAPGPVVSKSVNPKRPIKGAPSSIAVNKRKRPDGKPKAISEEEASALKAREAAKKSGEEGEIVARPLHTLIFKHACKSSPYRQR